MPELDCPTEVLEVMPSSLRVSTAGIRESDDGLVTYVEQRVRPERQRPCSEPFPGTPDARPRWEQWCIEHQSLIGGLIAGTMVAVSALVILTDDSGRSTSAQQPTQTAYQQGYSYGQRLDNEGYGSDEAYSACRGRESQQQNVNDAGSFQLACDLGYAR